MNTLDYIPTGRKNAVKLETLISATGLSGRKVHRDIERLRCTGEIIINLQDGHGYFRSENIDDIKAQLKQNNSRAMSVLSQQKYLRWKINELENANRVTE